jgi:hypothetical protein
MSCGVGTGHWRICRHPRLGLEAVEGAEAIFVVVADAPAAQFVLDQIESKLGLCQLIIRSSTIFSQMDFAVRQTGAENRSAVFGAPFTGSKLAANRRSSLEGSLLSPKRRAPILESHIERDSARRPTG